MKILKQIQTFSADETEKVGFDLASEMLREPSMPRFVALEGDLGVGKTVFVRGFTSVVAPGSAVRSPTFALVNEYRNKETRKTVYHFDVYRIADEDDLYSIGFYDYIDRGICLVEWSENIRYAFPKKYLTVRIEKDNAENTESRLITILSSEA